MAATLGAPVTEPQGKSARNKSSSVVEDATSALTVEVIWKSVR